MEQLQELYVFYDWCVSMIHHHAFFWLFIILVISALTLSAWVYTAGFADKLPNILSYAVFFISIGCLVCALTIGVIILNAAYRGNGYADDKGTLVNSTLNYMVNTLTEDTQILNIDIVEETESYDTINITYLDDTESSEPSTMTVRLNPKYITFKTVEDANWSIQFKQKYEYDEYESKNIMYYTGVKFYCPKRG